MRLSQVIAGIGASLLVGACGGSSPEPGAQPGTSAAPVQAAAQPPVAAAPAMTPSGVPPIPFEGAARPPEIVRAVYTFAADHPEILSRVPCFCGCQRMGHRDNDDCFVSSRNQAGLVAAWEPHGAT